MAKSKYVKLEINTTSAVTRVNNIVGATCVGMFVDNMGSGKMYALFERPDPASKSRPKKVASKPQPVDSKAATAFPAGEVRSA